MANITPETRYKSFFHVFLIVLNATMGAFFFGYHIGVFNPMQTNIEMLYNWDDNQKSINDGLVTGFMPLGGIVGAAFAGVISGKLGRRLSFIVLDGIAIASSGILMIKGFAPLLIGRFIAGISIGGNSAIVPLYINEVAPQELAGSLGSMTQLMINVGILVAFLLGLGVPKATDFSESNNFWRFMFAFPIITCSIRIITLLLVYRQDTPAYLAQKGQEEDAKKMLNKIYKPEFVDEAYNQLAAAQASQGQKKMGYGELVSRRYRLRLFVGMALAFFQQLSGINAVLSYSDKIFKGDHPTEDDENNAKIMTVVIGIILIIASYISGAIIDKFGRKIILVIGEATCIITLGILAICGYQDWTTGGKVMIFIYVIGFGVSLGPIVWLYLPEILPELGVGLSALSCWLFTFAIVFLFPIMKDNIQIQGTFLVFLGFCFAGLLFIFFLVKETKGKTQEQIEDEYLGGDVEKKKILTQDYSEYVR